MSTEFIQPRFESGQRGSQILREFEHDPYRNQQKPVDGSTCPVCHASVRKGRWRWVSAPDLAAVKSIPPPVLKCPACRRIAANDPAGIVQLGGAYFSLHQAEIMALIQHVADREMTEHPLERIMKLSDNTEFTTSTDHYSADSVVITTTGIHIARALAHAVERSHKGQLTQHYNEGEQRVRVLWQRD